MGGSTISWVPCGKKLTCSFPGIKFAYGPDTYFDKEVSVLEMDGKFDNLQELIYVESHLSNTATKFYGELTQQMLKLSDPQAPTMALVSSRRCALLRSARSTRRSPARRLLLLLLRPRSTRWNVCWCKFITRPRREEGRR